MAIRTGQIVTSATPVQIDGTSTSPYKLILHNASANDSIYIGNGDLTTSTGFDLHSKSTLTLDMPPLTNVWVIGPSGNPTINWMSIS